MNRELLEKPFEPNQIKQREGMFGKTLDYIEGHAVIQRLNEAFEAEWSFSILKNEVLKETDEVIVLGELRACNVVKTQFGSSKITRAKANGEPISLADDYKAAATDCLKKAATMLGVGLHLYNGDKPTAGRTNNGGNGSRKPYQDPPKQSANGDRRGGNGNGNGDGNGNGRLSSAQYNFILRLAKDRNLTRKEMNQKALEAYGVVLEHISKADAHSLIEELKTN
jgi:hypothetical protein